MPVSDIPQVGIVDLNREGKVWMMRDIFTGMPGSGRFCPNVGDMIIDPETGYYQVTTIDITTGKSTFIPWTVSTAIENNVIIDQLLGVGTGYQSETWRVYIDTRQMPYSLQIDGRLHVYRSDADHYKVFLGTDVTDNGTVISAYYNSSNVFQGENIPLEHVGNDNVNNWAIWAPKAGHTNRRLNDGEVVTVVIYNATGHKLSHASMLIQNTSLVRRTEAGLKRVRSIGLKSPYLSESDPTQLIVPINVDLRAVGLTGVVRYNTGEEMDVPIQLEGHGKMSLHGLQWYSPTIQSYPKPLTLSYRLSEDEYTLEHGVTENGYITEAFSIKAVPADNAYSVRLYVFPTWNGAARRYDLDFWMFNIDRDVYYRVPRNVIEIPDNEVAFDGENYTTRQRLKFGVKLSNVDPIYTDHRFVQSVDISLSKPGTDPGDKWQILPDHTTNDWYGAGVIAKNRFVNTNLSYLTIHNDIDSLNEWLDKIYYPLNHLFDDTSEIRAPEPTHFYVHTQSREYKFPIQQWNQELTIMNDVAIGTTIILRWVHETVQGEWQLGVTGLALEQAN